jgi:ABC-type transport system involved in cytochrome bd biosynthesis fused ATPase/permease subunit
MIGKKVAMLGMWGVGKSSLVHLFVNMMKSISAR